jgi:hypothetical protein
VGSAAHLKLEKPHFLFLEGSGGAAATPVGAAVVLTGASAALAGTSSAAASAARGDGGREFHLLGGSAPRRSLPPPLPMTTPPASPEGRVLAARAAGTPHCTTPGALAAEAFSPSPAPPSLVPAAARRG